MNFYRTVSETSSRSGDQGAGVEFATEEADHTMALDKMIAQTQQGPEGMAADRQRGGPPAPDENTGPSLRRRYHFPVPRPC